MARKARAPNFVIFISFCSLLLAVFLFQPHIACAHQQVELNLEDDRISLEAQQIPLIDILKAISQQAQIILVTSDAMDEPVSVTLQSLSIEDTIERILANRNFAMFYNLQGDGSFRPSEIHVFGSRSPATYLPAEVSSPDHDDHDDSLKHYSRDWYEKTFQQTDKILSQISAQPIQPGSVESDPLAIGIEVKQVAQDSAFSQIGIRQNDQIRGVNGMSVKSTAAFIQALQSAHKQGSTIRIERLDANNQIDPIYIELH